MINYLLSRMNSGFVRSVALVSGGAVVSQGLTVAVTPILTRLFSPESFGALGAFVSALTIVVSIGSLKYELAIPQVKSAKHARELAILAFAIVFLLSIFSAIIIAALKNLSPLEIDSYYWLLPLGLLFAGGFQIATYIAIRQKNFSALTTANIKKSLVQAMLQIAAGLMSLPGIFLIVGYVVSQGAAGFKILFFALYGHKIPHRLRLAALSKKFARFPLLAAPASVLNAAATNISPFILIFYFGLHEAGLFALAQRAMGAPMAFLGNAIANVYLSEIPRLWEDSPERVRSFYIKTLKALLLLGLPLVTVSAGFLYYTVDYIFGDLWSGAATTVIVLAPLFLGQFVVSPLSQTLNVIGRQDVQLKWDALRLVVPNFGLVIAAHLGCEFDQALFIFSCLMFVVYLINIAVTLVVMRSQSAKSLL